MIFLLYIVFWPLITYISTLQQTRAIFAMSFDGVLPKGVTRVNRYGCPWLALLIAMLASSVVFIYAVYDQTGFFIVLAYALLVQLIAMGFVGLSGVLAPKLRPELYRASTSQKTVAGIPLVSIAGVGAIVTGVFVWWAYLHYDQLGANAEHGQVAGVDGRACHPRVRPLLRRGDDQARPGRRRRAGIQGDPTRVAHRRRAGLPHRPDPRRDA